MKLKNVIKGKRVVLKSAVRADRGHTIQEGAYGKILNNNHRTPYVQWDGFTGGHSYGDPTLPDSSWAVSISNLRKA